MARLDNSNHEAALRDGFYLRCSWLAQTRVLGGGFAFAVPERHCAPQQCDRFWEERAIRDCGSQPRTAARVVGPQLRLQTRQPIFRGSERMHTFKPQGPVESRHRYAFALPEPEARSGENGARVQPMRAPSFSIVARFGHLIG